MSGNAYISIGADSSDFTAAMAEAQDSLNQLMVKAQGTTDSLAPLSGAMRRTLADLDPMSGAAAQTARQFDTLKAAIERGAVSGEQGTRALKTLSERMRFAAENGGKLTESMGNGGGQAGIFREKMVMLHETLMGNYSRLAGSTLVLAERTGGFTGVLGALINPLTLTLASVGLVAGGLIKMTIASEESEREMNGLKMAFAAVGHAGAATGSQLKDMVDHVSSLAGIDREAADQIVTAFARTRSIGGPLMTALTADIDKTARAMGVDAPQAAKVLAGAFADPSKGARELDQAYGFLSISQIRQIETMQRQGDMIGAQNLLLQAYKGWLGGLPDDLTNIQKSANNLATAWDRLTHSVGESAVWKTARDAVAGLMNVMASAISPDSLDQKINKTKASIRDLTTQIATLKSQEAQGASIYAADYEAELILAQRHLKQLESQKTAQDDLNAAEEKGNAITAQSGKGGGQNDVAIQRKADLNDPSMVTTREKIAAIDDVIGRLQKERIGANPQEIQGLNERIALQQKLKDDLVKSQAPKDQPTTMEKWRDDLANQQAALAQAHAEDQNYRQQQLALEVSFWSQKVSIAKAGTKEQLDAEKAKTEAQKQLYEADAAAAKQAAQTKAANAKIVADTDVRIQQIQLQGQKDELDAEVDAHKISTEQKILKLQELTQAEQASALARLDAEIASLQEGTTAWTEAAQKRRVMMVEQETANQKLATQLTKAQEDAAKQSTKAWEESTQPIGRAFDGMVSGILQGTQTVGQAMKKMGVDIALSFAESIAKMLIQFGAFKLFNMLGWAQMAASSAASQTAMSAAVLGKETAMTSATVAGTAARNAAGATEESGFLGRVATQIGTWLGLETAKTADTVTGTTTRDTAEGAAAIASIAAAKATAVGTIPAYAAEAAAAAMSSVAAIPFVGWAMAPGVGMETFATAMAFMPMASAAGGWGQVPFDGAVTELHKDEMVLPSSIATPMRALLATMSGAGRTNGGSDQGFAIPSLSPPSAANSNAANSNGTSANGTIHIIYAPVIQAAPNMTPAQFNNLLTQNSQAVLKNVNNALANGGKLGGR